MILYQISIYILRISELSWKLKREANLKKRRKLATREHTYKPWLGSFTNRVNFSQISTAAGGLSVKSARPEGSINKERDIFWTSAKFGQSTFFGLRNALVNVPYKMGNLCRPWNYSFVFIEGVHFYKNSPLSFEIFTFAEDVLILICKTLRCIVWLPKVLFFVVSVNDEAR